MSGIRLGLLPARSGRLPRLWLAKELVKAGDRRVVAADGRQAYEGWPGQYLCQGLGSRRAETTQLDYGRQLGRVCMIFLFVLHAAG